MATTQTRTTQTRTTPRTYAFEGQVPAEGVRDPGYLAFWLLRVGFTAAPILFGLDKFFDWMVEWDLYLWSGVSDALNMSAGDVMLIVGAIEIVAGLVVLVAPRIGGSLVAVWLAGIITNLVIASIDGPFEFWDIALRDFGLFIGAVALVVLAMKYGPLAARGPAGSTTTGAGGGNGRRR